MAETTEIIEPILFDPNFASVSGATAGGAPMRALKEHLEAEFGDALQSCECGLVMPAVGVRFRLAHRLRVCHAGSRQRVDLSDGCLPPGVYEAGKMHHGQSSHEIKVTPVNDDGSLGSPIEICTGYGVVRPGASIDWRAVSKVLTEA